jgi:hypothetical protein
MEARDWAALVKQIEERPMLVNTIYRRGRSTFHLLHEVVRHDVPRSVVHDLVKLGAFKTVKDSSGRRPVDIARKSGFDDLVIPLKTEALHPGDRKNLAYIQELFHGLIRAFMLAYKAPTDLRLPPLSILTEGWNTKVWFPIPGMYGGFHFWLDSDDNGTFLIADSWCRVCGGSEMRHRITPFEAVLIEEG